MKIKILTTITVEYIICVNNSVTGIVIIIILYIFRRLFIRQCGS